MSNAVRYTPEGITARFCRASTSRSREIGVGSAFSCVFARERLLAPQTIPEDA